MSNTERLISLWLYFVWLLNYFEWKQHVKSQLAKTNNPTIRAMITVMSNVCQVNYINR